MSSLHRTNEHNLGRANYQHSLNRESHTYQSQTRLQKPTRRSQLEKANLFKNAIEIDLPSAHAIRRISEPKSRRGKTELLKNDASHATPKLVALVPRNGTYFRLASPQSRHSLWGLLVRTTDSFLSLSLHPSIYIDNYISH